jgi:hypothetical protein
MSGFLFFTPIWNTSMISARSCHSGFCEISFWIPVSRSSIFSSIQVICSSIPSFTQSGRVDRRFFSATSSTNSCRRCSTYAANCSSSGVCCPFTAGRTTLAKWAITCASILSVFAKNPNALANCLARDQVRHGDPGYETVFVYRMTNDLPCLLDSTQ